MWNAIHEPIAMPPCFTSGDKLPISYDHANPNMSLTRASSSSSSVSPQSLIMSVYETRLASQSRLVTVTWCKNILLHGLSVSVDGPDGQDHHHCKVELKPWYFWRKQGSKQFLVDEETIISVVWDLKAAKFNGEVEPQSDYYVAIVCEQQVVLVIGDMKKDAFRKTGCPPSLFDPVLVSRKEYVFGKKKFSTRVRFNERGRSHEISVECNKSNGNNNHQTTVENVLDGVTPEMDIKIDGELATKVKHLQWKFRGNESIDVRETKTKIQVYWDVHDWIFGSGPRHAMFLFKPLLPSTSLSSSLSSFHADDSAYASPDKSGGFCLFLYAWKVE